MFCISQSISQHPLARGVALERMQVGHARQGGQPLVPLGVVLHRTRPERIEIGVDRHVLRRQIDEVAHQVDLGDLRQGRRRVGQGGGRQQVLRLRRPARRTPAGGAQRRPGWLSSNSRAVDWFFSMRSFHQLRSASEGCATPRLRFGLVAMSLLNGSPMQRSIALDVRARPPRRRRQRLGQGGGQAVDLRPRPLLGHGDAETQSSSLGSQRPRCRPA